MFLGQKAGAKRGTERAKLQGVGMDWRPSARRGVRFAPLFFVVSCMAASPGDAPYLEEGHAEHDHGIEISSTSQAHSSSNRWQMPADVAAIAKTQTLAYEGFDGCVAGGTLFSGVRTLSDYVARHFAGSWKIWRGAYCRKIAGSSSNSIHGTGRAIDVMMSGYSNGDRLANWLAMNAKALGIQMIIWRRSTWKASRGYITYYGGSSSHNDHLHIEFNDAGAGAHTSWYNNGGPHRGPYDNGSSGGGGSSAPAPAPAPPTFKAKFAKLDGSDVNGMKLSGRVGETRTVSFAFTNTGTGTWEADQVKLVVSGRTSKGTLRTINSKWGSGSVISRLSSDVGPEKTQSFSFNVRLPSNHDGLRMYVGLVRDAGDKRTWLAGGNGQDPIHFEIKRPEPAAAFTKLGDTDPNGVTLKGEVDDVRAVKFAFKNTGQDYWQPGEIRLLVAPAVTDDVAADVRTPSWNAARVLGALGSRVSPGESARFAFDARLPAGRDGLRFRVALHYDNGSIKRWLIGGPGQTKIYFDIDQPAWAADFAESDSLDPNRVLISGYDGEIHTVEFSFRNTGGKTWNPEEVKLVLAAPTPVDEAGIMTPTWLSSNELATVQQATAPGAVGRFSFDANIPDSIDKIEMFVGLVHEAEKQHWMAGTQAQGSLSFDIVRLDRTIVVEKANGETETVPVYEPESPELGSVDYAGSTPTTLAYEHEGISGGCIITTQGKGLPTTFPFATLLLGLLLLARTRRAKR